MQRATIYFHKLDDGYLNNISFKMWYYLFHTIALYLLFLFNSLIFRGNFYVPQKSLAYCTTPIYGMYNMKYTLQCHDYFREAASSMDVIVHKPNGGGEIIKIEQLINWKQTNNLCLGKFTL